jgi:hypothetical protein
MDGFQSQLQISCIVTAYAGQFEQLIRSRHAGQRSGGGRPEGYVFMFEQTAQAKSHGVWNPSRISYSLNSDKMSDQKNAGPYGYPASLFTQEKYF